MKNLLRKGLLFLCVLMLTFAMAACGSDKSDDTKEKEDTKTEEENKDDADDADDAGQDEQDDQDSLDDTDADDAGLTSEGKFKSLDRFVNSDIMQSQLETQMSTLEGTGISCSLEADGDKLIYNFVIEDEAVAAIMDKTTLDSTLKDQADTFSGIAAMLPAAVDGVENPVVVVRYLDNTGAVITSMEFPAE